MRFAKDYAIKNGPIVVEFSTYRYHGHSMSDPGISYRTREEITEVRKTRDPIEIVKKHIIDNKFATEKELKDIEKRVRAEIEADAEKIKTDPEPGDFELYNHVLQGPSYVRGVEY